MRVNLQPSYIVHSRPYRDSSALLEVFTAEHGRLSLVARGARRQSRRGSTAAILQPFTPLLLSFSGRSELKTLTATESAGQTHALRGERMFSGLYLNELLSRLLHRHDPHPQLFAAYGIALEGLAGSLELDSLLRRFELTLLNELGYSFDLNVDGASGEPVEEALCYQYDPGLGLVARIGGVAESGATYAGADLLAMAAGELDGPVKLTAKRLLRQALAAHLGDEPLRSRDLFRAGRAPGTSPASGAPNTHESKP